MKLVIVESPSKSKTIQGYLGDEYLVEASVGHIRDLAIRGHGGFGVDIENNFAPQYSVIKGKEKVISNLKKLQKKCDEVILATDPDREGEAIAWHLADVLSLDVSQTKRLEFHEITENSINEALLNPRTINNNLVHSQETRRIIDRVLGFKISPLLMNKIGSKSAGRVQSVTLKMIVEHEEEINKFVPEEFWEINADIIKDKKNYSLLLTKVGEDNLEIHNEEEVKNIISNLNNSLKVSDIIVKEKKLSPKLPFITSTLTQEANSKFKYSAKVTSQIIQKLYEGIETDEGIVGLITYIRTDSTRLSDSFIEEGEQYILDNYSSKYYQGYKNKKKKNLTQDAHEAIRPTSLSRTPEKMKAFLDSKSYKIYKLIFNRSIQALMSPKLLELTNISFSSNDYIFSIHGAKTLFDGYSILDDDNEKDENLPEFQLGEEIPCNEFIPTQKFTKAPARYNEGKIVSIMESKGIGRPSTYSSTIQTLFAREYIISTKEGIVPTEQGIKTVKVLNKYFPDLMNYKYSADMETKLDEISEGETSELNVLNDFYYPFIEHFDEVNKVFYKDEPKYLEELCPLCNNKLVVKKNKKGKEFIGCSNYPNCHYIKKEEPELVGRVCPNCGKDLLYRKNKKGDKFIGCSNFPKCHYVEGIKEEDTNETKICPDCGALLVKKKGRKGYFYGCSNYPNCNHMEPYSKK
ncbi:MAG: type I DNA topoisomerase [Bacillales bacterium]